jgi:hypothetical protein
MPVGVPKAHVHSHVPIALRHTAEEDDVLPRLQSDSIPINFLSAADPSSDNLAGFDHIGCGTVLGGEFARGRGDRAVSLTDPLASLGGGGFVRDQQDGQGEPCRSGDGAMSHLCVIVVLEF